MVLVGSPHKRGQWGLSSGDATRHDYCVVAVAIRGIQICTDFVDREVIGLVEEAAVATSEAQTRTRRV